MGDLLETPSEWKFLEETNESICWGIMGSRFWYCNDEYGNVAVVDSARVAKIVTAITSTGHGRGLSRVEIYHYLVQFYYDKDKHRNRYDKVFSFRTQEGREEAQFMQWPWWKETTRWWRAGRSKSILYVGPHGVMG